MPIVSRLLVCWGRSLEATAFVGDRSSSDVVGSVSSTVLRTSSIIAVVDVNVAVSRALSSRKWRRGGSRLWDERIQGLAVENVDLTANRERVVVVDVGGHLSTAQDTFVDENCSHLVLVDVDHEAFAREPDRRPAVDVKHRHLHRRVNLLHKYVSKS